MRIWIDAQLPPALARWLQERWGVDATAVRDLGLREATDRAIFMAARKADAVVISKDRDFVELLELHGPPPRVVWVTCGNTSNARLRQVLASAWPTAAALLLAGEPLVEIGDTSTSGRQPSIPPLV